MVKLRKHDAKVEWGLHGDKRPWTNVSAKAEQDLWGRLSGSWESFLTICLFVKIMTPAIIALNRDV